jgi:pyrimidine operon attenuation protein/uracil phosphoribosyltransferase
MGHAAGTYKKVRLMDETAMARVVARMAHEIVEAEGGTKDVALIGIRTRGVPLAQRLAVQIEKSEGARLPVGLLDITLYRDDLTTVAASPVLKRTDISFPVEGKTVVLCDDVLFTGRTVRAAIDAVLDFGRPRKILLAILVDRGRRELPIEAQFIGKKISTSASEIVAVTFRETDTEDDVWLLDREIARVVPAGKPRKSRKAGKPARSTKPIVGSRPVVGSKPVSRVAPSRKAAVRTRPKR